MKSLYHSRRNLNFLFLLLIMTMTVACGEQSVRTVEIRGIYGHPKPLWDKEIKLPDLGINAAFVHGGSIDSALMEQALADGIDIYSEFATLNGKGYVEDHPEAWAINEKGERVEAATWFMGVCPTEPGFREYRFDQLRQLLRRYDVKGIWMDYVHWHAQFEDPEPILPETCFCDHCLNQFSTESSIDIVGSTTADKANWILHNHDAEWRDWRCHVIRDWAIAFRTIIQEEKPGTLLGIYHCPWNDEEFDGARRRILGLDYDLLRDVVDVFSPMVYHATMGRGPEWVEENIVWFCDRVNIKPGTTPKVWPIVQAYNNPGKVSAEEFEKVMRGGLAGASSGVMMFTTRSVAEEDEKVAVVKKLYLEILSQQQP